MRDGKLFRKMIWRAWLTMQLLMVISGCASITAERANTPTGGLEMTMFAKDETGAETFYEVKRHGTLGFGGGMNARLNKIAWTGQMTESEIQELRSLVAQGNWLDDRPKSMDETSEARYRISISTVDGQTRFSLKGEHPRVKPVRELLGRISLRRLNEDLQRLPQPSGKKP